LIRFDLQNKEEVVKNLSHIIVSIWLFFPCSPLSALLPPLWQGIAEIQAIIEDKRLGEHLHAGESLLEIKKVEGGYLLITNQQLLFAEIIVEPSTIAGPKKFTVVFIPQSASNLQFEPYQSSNSR